MRLGHRRLSTTLLAGTLAASACSNLPADDQTGDRGSIQLAVAAPPSGVGCLRVTTTGASRAVARSIGITAGIPVSTSLTGLPTGLVSVAAEAFAETCTMVTTTSTPTWTGDPMNVTLAAGVATPVQLTMRQNGRISLSVDWDTGESDGGTTGGGGPDGGPPGGGGLDGGSSSGCPGCAQLSSPLTSDTQQGLFLVNMFAAPVNAGASVSARLCLVSGTGGAVQLLVEDANFQFAGAAGPIANVTTCDKGFSQFGIVLNNLDSTRIAAVGVQLIAAPPAPWSNPTIINVDSITLANPNAPQFRFTTGLDGLLVDGVSVPGSTVTWLAP